MVGALSGAALAERTPLQRPSRLLRPTSVMVGALSGDASVVQTFHSTQLTLPPNPPFAARRPNSKELVPDVPQPADETLATTLRRTTERPRVGLVAS